MEITLKEIEDAIRKIELDKFIEPLGNGLYRVNGNTICDKRFLKEIDRAIIEELKKK